MQQKWFQSSLTNDEYSMVQLKHVTEHNQKRLQTSLMLLIEQVTMLYRKKLSIKLPPKQTLTHLY